MQHEIDNGDMWVAGYLSGKYEQDGSLPDNVDQAHEWLAGFVIGLCEVCEYEIAHQRIEERLKHHDKARELVKMVMLEDKIRGSDEQPESDTDILSTERHADDRRYH